MINEIDADLLTYDLDAIVHSCNCFRTMGAGIALRIRQKYPEAYKADCETGSGDFDKLGTFSYAVLPSNKHIFNLYSQFGYGRDKRYTNYEAMYKGLEAIEKFMVKNGLKTIGLPNRMGCNLAGGDFRIVRAIIEVIFDKSPITCYICNYDK